MDDTQGATRIADSGKYTVRFDADGRAVFRLDCNRGTGSWQATQSGNSGGSLSFGPLAATRALCSPPHLDERIARDMTFVRSYLFKGDKLYLSLMADGGIYEWAPLPN